MDNRGRLPVQRIPDGWLRLVAWSPNEEGTAPDVDAELCGWECAVDYVTHRSGLYQCEATQAVCVCGLAPNHDGRHACNTCSMKWWGGGGLHG